MPCAELGPGHPSLGPSPPDPVDPRDHRQVEESGRVRLDGYDEIEGVADS